MSWSRIYRGEWVDIETDLNNDNIQATKRIDIIDGNSNPYNISYTSVVVGPNIDFTFTFDPLPAGTTSVAIGYSSDGGQTWNSQTGGFTSPRVITLPFSAYIFQFVIHPTNETFYEEDEIIELEMADDPLRDIVIDNDEDKFVPIRARQLEIKVYSSNNISINKFSQGGDNTFKVNYYIDSVLEFTGFLSLGDLSQEFMPHPNIINLVAVDGIGFLNDIPLTDFDGETPQNENPIIDYLLWALSKTGLQLNLSATFNIREVTALSLSGDATGAGHFFKYCYLDAKTFEDEPGTCINCYDVITRILGEEGQLSQRLGEWRIIRIDEIEHGLATQTVYQWNYQGNFLGKFSETHEKNVGIGEDHSWMNDDCIVAIERLVKEVRLDYRFETPKEIPCNVDFERDSENPTIISPTENHYILDCWDKFKSDGTATTTPVYIRRDYDGNGYEIARYIVIEQNTDFVYIQSQKIYVDQKDKFNLGVNMRMESDSAGSGPFNDFSVQVRLYGDDGTFWTYKPKWYNDDEQKWYQCTAAFNTFQKYYSWDSNFDKDQRESVSLFDGQTTEIPATGYIYVHIHSSQQFGDTSDTYIDSCTFDYIPYVNGSYLKYKSQRHIVKQDVEERNIREREVFISDSPKKMYKGALLIYDSGANTFPLAGLFYNAAQEPSGPVNEKRYGEIQAFDVWNQYNRNMVKFDGTIDHGKPNLIAKYYMTDLNENTVDRIFLLLHYELDAHLCEWQAFFMEVSKYDSKIYDGHSFKFLTE